MENSNSTSFIKMFFLASFVFFSVTLSVAQTSDSQFMRVANPEDGKTKKDNSVSNTNKISNTNSAVTTPAPILQPNYEELSKGRSKAVAEDDNTFAKPVPVTYVGDEKKMTEVIYAIDSNESNFDNLTNLIDMRNKVHASDNHVTLIQTEKYNQLLSDIAKYRTKFDTDVNKKGFENCSKREQSLFLSFLKQEGKQEDYKAYISKLKQD